MFEHVFEEVNVRAKSFTVYGVSRQGTTVVPEKSWATARCTVHAEPLMSGNMRPNEEIGTTSDRL